ncbi:MAG: cytoplasmic protein [Rhizobiaceae bacterium]
MQTEVLAFRTRKASEAADARQTAALQLACGIDFASALQSKGRERTRIRQRIARQLKRERIRGLRHHWSYDLNRHIALKEALDRLGK